MEKQLMVGSFGDIDDDGRDKFGFRNRTPESPDILPDPNRPLYLYIMDFKEVLQTFNRKSSSSDSAFGNISYIIIIGIVVYTTKKLYKINWKT